MITEITMNNKTFYCSDIGNGYMNSDLEKVEEFEKGRIAQHLWESLYKTYGWGSQLHIISVEELMDFINYVKDLTGGKE